MNDQQKHSIVRYMQLRKYRHFLSPKMVLDQIHDFWKFYFRICVDFLDRAWYNIFMMSKYYSLYINYSETSRRMPAEGTGHAPRGGFAG